MTRLINTSLKVVVLAVLCHSSLAQKARPYFDELYKAGGLDRYADQFVCFADDQDNENFFIFAKSETLKNFLMENDGFKTLSAKSRALLNKGFLFVRGYNKGIPLGDGQDQYVKDGESWVSDPFQFDKVTTGRMRLRISFETMRYKRTVEAIKDHATREVANGFGRCEAISGAIPQKAN